MRKKKPAKLLSFMSLFIAVASCAIIAAGCQNGSGKEDASSGDPSASTAEPVTVQIMLSKLKPESVFFPKWAERVKQKYPNITLEQVEPSEGNRPEQIVASGNVPDIFVQATGQLNSMAGMGLFYDMSDLIKKYNIDLAKFDQAGMELIRGSNPGHWITALPLDQHYDALYYNKDIFDKFGVPYPKDDMTWEQLLPLHKQLSRLSDNVQYRGIVVNMPRAASQLKLGFIDPKTNKAAVNTKAWKDLLTFVNDVYQVPGNSDYLNLQGEIKLFLNDQRLAMLPGNNFLIKLDEAKTLTNWDLVSYPYFAQNAHKSWNYSGQLLLLTASSKKKDAAIKAIEVITSDDNLSEMSRSGVQVAVNNPKIQQAFAADLAIAKGKNLAAIFKTSPADPAPDFMLDIRDDASKIVEKAFDSEIVSGKKDVNTVLRESEEKINQLLNQAAAK
ncbi:MAG: extracellular solute-binding protein family 1 [Paenibacillaceae bacterium]|nr:extracellular solute-binding protein family 1 [Paenibacillaceae bacterium]